MAPFRTCILHIGFEKTGSTSIQAFLTGHVERLQRLGHFVPRSLARTDGFCNHLRLAAHALRDDRLGDDVRIHYGAVTPHALGELRAATPRLLADEIRTRGAARTLLLSNEHLSSRLDDTAELIRLRDLLGAFCDGFRIIAYLRNQADVLESVYGEAIKAGYHDIALVPDFSGRDPNPWIAREYFEYGRTLERWVEVFGQDRVEVRVFDRGTLRSGDVVRDFLCCIGVDPSRFADLPRVNERLGGRVQAFLLELNRSLRSLPADEAARIRDAVVDLLSPVSDGPGRQLAEPEMRHFMAQFEQQNEWVRARWFPSSPTLFPPGRPRAPSGQPDPGIPAADTFELIAVLLRKLVPGG